MAEEVVIKVDVELDGSIAEVRDLKQQFADAEEAVFKLAGAGQQSTQAFADATLEAAKLKQEVDNINSSIDELKPDVKLAAFGRTISGVASGFSAATGAAALLGGESEDLQKTLVKVQAAMAFSMGIRGLADLKQGFKVLALVIKTNPIFLVGTVITSIGVALFLLRDKIAIIGKSFKFLGDGIAKLIQLAKNFSDEMLGTTFIASDALKASLKANQKSIEATARAYDLDIRAARRNLEDTKSIEIEKLTILKELNEKRRTLLFKNAKENRKELKELFLANVEFQQKILDLEAAKAREKIAIKKEVKKQSQELDGENLSGKDIDPAVQKELDATEALKQQLIARRILTEEDKLIKLQLIKDQELIDAEEDFNKTFKTEEDRRLHLDNLILIELEFAQRQIEIEKDLDAVKASNSQKEKDRSEKLHAEKLDRNKRLFETTVAVSGAIFAVKLRNAEAGSKEEEKILKRQFKVNKAFQLAQAAINGVQAVQAIMATAVDPTGTTTAIRVGATIATTAANLAKIGATKFQGTSASFPAASVPKPPDPFKVKGGVSEQAPNLAQTGSTQLNPDGSVASFITQDQRFVRAVVVESDITGSQNDIRSIEDKATFA